MPKELIRSTALKRLLASLQNLATKPLSKATAMPPAVYTCADFYALEQEKIFTQQWLCAGLAGSIPNVGDYLSYRIGEQPVVVIRQNDGAINAYANVCRHRMMQLLEGQGNCKRLVCPYHAWTYGLDGQLMFAPHMRERPGFDVKDIALSTIRCELWEGWIYLTLNPEVKPVAASLQPLQKIVADYHMTHYVPIMQRDHTWNSNWKLLAENFMEGYHLPVAHRATVGPYIGLKETQFPKHVHKAFTYQCYTKSEKAPVGTAHTDNKTLHGEQRRTSVLPTIFPSHMFSLAPDHLWYLSVQPKGCDQIAIRYGAALAPEVLAASEDKDKLIADITQFLDRVNEEDRFVVEGIFTGAKAALSTPGPLCWLERENHAFTRYLAGCLCT